jgi:DNA (cytosine-5)-methyltransferase 1
LTVRECARLQAFPDTFRFFGTLSEQYQLVANAFPPLVSERLAKVILPCLCAGLQEQVRARQIA